MFGRAPHHAPPQPLASRLTGLLAPILLIAFLLLTVVWLAPGMPAPAQDGAWALAINQAMADHLAFGRDVMYPLGPWSDVYAGVFHPAADRMMLAGGAGVALAMAAGLLSLVDGWRRWAMLLMPLLVASVDARDPVFVILPLLLVALAVARPLTRPRQAALLMLVAACALLTLVKGTFGTEAVPMVALAALAMALQRRFGLAALMLVTYGASLCGLWLISGQALADLPRYALSMLAIIGGYSEGLASPGPWSDIAAYLAASTIFLLLCWRARAPGIVVLLPATAFTLFVAFKSGFVRHDEHALIAAGTLAMAPLTLAAALRPRGLLVALLVTLPTLAFISQNGPGTEWPSWPHSRDRVARAAMGAWNRLADPGLLRRQFDANIAAVRIGMPLPHVKGPTDIYSSGQMLLLANGLDWSPRPAIQSVTVLGKTLADADLAHLQETDTGTKTPAPVPVPANVFYRVEDEDNRLRTTMDGPSWPILLSQYRVASYDRALDLALLQRQPGATPAMPFGSPLLDGAYRLDQEIALPAFPDGLAWATFDIEPTLLGRIAALLFRPPLLSIAIRYADGHTGRYRLVSALARLGFLLTPPVDDTPDMLRLLLPERRAAGSRPVAFTITGEAGSRWLWQTAFAVRLRRIAIPVQDQVRDMLRPTPLSAAAPHPSLAPAEICIIDLVGGHRPSAKPVMVHGILMVNGWTIPSVARIEMPGPVRIRLTDAAGHTWEALADPRPRLDVSGYLMNPAFTQTGWDARIDVTHLQGEYAMTIESGAADGRWRCQQTQSIIVENQPRAD